MEIFVMERDESFAHFVHGYDDLRSKCQYHQEPQQKLSNECYMHLFPPDFLSKLSKYIYVSPGPVESGPVDISAKSLPWILVT